MPTKEEVIANTTKAARTSTKQVVKADEAFTEGPAQVLLKMDRKNVVYEVRGVRFTKDHPFAVTDEETALQIMAEVDGIRFASPLEAREFYS